MWLNNPARVRFNSRSAPYNAESASKLLIVPPSIRDHSPRSVSSPWCVGHWKFPSLCLKNRVEIRKYAQFTNWPGFTTFELFITFAMQIHKIKSSFWSGKLAEINIFKVLHWKWNLIKWHLRTTCGEHRGRIEHTNEGLGNALCGLSANHSDPGNFSGFIQCFSDIKDFSRLDSISSGSDFSRRFS
jgi:hypothetical protein